MPGRKEARQKVSPNGDGEKSGMNADAYGDGGEL